MNTNRADGPPYLLQVADYVTRVALIWSTARTLGARLNKPADVALAVVTTVMVAGIPPRPAPRPVTD